MPRPLILLAQNRQDDRDRVQIEQDRQRAERNLADTEYLAREVVALRLAMQGHGDQGLHPRRAARPARRARRARRRREGEQAAVPDRADRPRRPCRVRSARGASTRRSASPITELDMVGAVVGRRRRARVASASS